MASQTNEQAFEAAIEKHLCGISVYHIGNPSKIKRQLPAQTQ
ncbi:hypothetical protein [Thiothrix winogradskyi]|nr:hypothetical protein [Thiothrix winogradskyi]